MILSKADLAKLLQRDAKIINDWVAAGCPHTKEGRFYKFEVAAVVRWREEYVRGLRKVCRESQGEFKLEHSERVQKERADKLAMENDVLRGELAPVAEMQAIWAEYVAAAKAKLLAMPPKLAKELADETRVPVVLELLETSVHEVAHELARGVDAS
ncbi:MAG: hypothetical protein JKY60_20540 [Kordiimonadaceae bacterium]|nr:hypothetical protein [Kordiimonadaceae bacterium]